MGLLVAWFQPVGSRRTWTSDSSHDDRYFEQMMITRWMCLARGGAASGAAWDAAGTRTRRTPMRCAETWWSDSDDDVCAAKTTVGATIAEAVQSGSTEAASSETEPTPKQLRRARQRARQRERRRAEHTISVKNTFIHVHSSGSDSGSTGSERPRSAPPESGRHEGDETSNGGRDRDVGLERQWASADVGHSSSCSAEEGDQRGSTVPNPAGTAPVMVSWDWPLDRRDQLLRVVQTTSKLLELQQQRASTLSEAALVEATDTIADYNDREFEGAHNRGHAEQQWHRDVVTAMTLVAQSLQHSLEWMTRDISVALEAASKVFADLMQHRRIELDADDQHAVATEGSMRRAPRRGICRGTHDDRESDQGDKWWHHERALRARFARELASEVKAASGKAALYVARLLAHANHLSYGGGSEARCTRSAWYDTLRDGSMFSNAEDLNWETAITTTGTTDTADTADRGTPEGSGAATQGASVDNHKLSQMKADKMHPMMKYGKNVAAVESGSDESSEKDNHRNTASWKSALGKQRRRRLE
eukprot:TRINITY_DN17947_c0_g4_i1.p1 TRINITY_DN17947_c0_g4~~TRINITY_DN17947_c0_g4_i1.p1  ORF type:complete len:534 (-),score=85.56 TRINITY_DN17947_c0_g4_i1:173-1774(-)